MAKVLINLKLGSVDSPAGKASFAKFSFIIILLIYKNIK